MWRVNRVKYAWSLDKCPEHSKCSKHGNYNNKTSHTICYLLMGHFVPGTALRDNMNAK